MHEELVKVTNELYTVSCMSDCSSLYCTYILAPKSWAEPETSSSSSDALSALLIKRILSPSSRGC